MFIEETRMLRMRKWSQKQTETNKLIQIVVQSLTLYDLPRCKAH